MSDKTRARGRQDLYDGFTEADSADTPQEMYDYLDAVDTLPAFRWYKRELRSLLAPGPGDRLLDVGCGAGTEACRLAGEYPAVNVLGLDRKAMLAEAEKRAERLGVTVTWLEGEAEAIPLAADTVDACMTERVLKYLPDPAAAIAEMVRVLRPGGRIACLELDMAATVLAGEPGITGRVLEFACANVGEPRMGRRLPRMLHDAGVARVRFQPVAFHMPRALNEAILYTTVRAAAEDGRLPAAGTAAWLDEQAAADADGLFTVAWIGWLVAGRVPHPPG